MRLRFPTEDVQEIEELGVCLSSTILSNDLVLGDEGTIGSKSVIHILFYFNVSHI